MSIFSYISKLDQKFSWSFFGFLLAVIFGGVTIYTGLIKKNAPDLIFEILSNANVLDVHESIGSLDILYKGSSLNRNNQSLRIVVLRVVNNGDQAILPSYYDPDDPIGFKILSGQIVERPIILEARSSYLRDHVRISQGNRGEVTFSRVILEPGDFFVVKVLLLYSNSEEPRVVPMGKVAGIKRISLTRQDKADSKRALGKVLFAGGLWIQLARAVFYSFVSLLTILVALMTSVSLAEVFSKKKRRAAVKAFREYAAPKLKGDSETLLAAFIDNDFFDLIKMYDLLSNEGKLKEVQKLEVKDLLNESRPVRSTRDYTRMLFRRLVDQGIIMPSGSDVKIDPARKEVLGEFIEFLRKGGFVPSSQFAGLHDIFNRD